MSSSNAAGAPTLGGPHVFQESTRRAGEMRDQLLADGKVSPEVMRLIGIAASKIKAIDPISPSWSSPSADKSVPNKFGTPSPAHETPPPPPPVFEESEFDSEWVPPPPPSPLSPPPSEHSRSGKVIILDDSPAHHDRRGDAPKGTGSIAT